MTKQIPLTQGKVAIVDDDDYDYLSQFKWCAHKERSGKIYALRGMGGRLNRKIVRMHTCILNPPARMEIDHINGNGLDNRKSNLRICTHTDNLKNVSRHCDSTSRYKGVSYCKDRKLWQVHIKVNGKKIALGRYATDEEAAHVYDNAARKYYGIFAKTNF